MELLPTGNWFLPERRLFMPFVSVPKDLAKVKTKVAFNLTKRQIVCFGLGGLAGIHAYILTRGSIGNETAALLMIGLMMPFFLFGIYEKDGRPLEKVLKNYLDVRFLRPTRRPYRTDNGYAALMRQAAFDKEVEKLEKKTAGRAEKKPPAGRKTAGRGKGWKKA